MSEYIPEQDASVRIDFIRHSEHINEDKDSDLTPNGFNEAEQLASKLSINYEQSLGVSVGNFRSLFTTLAIVAPELVMDVSGDIEKISKHRVVVDGNIQYSDPSEHENFLRDMISAVNEKRVFKFLFEESDKYNNSKYELITSYRTMSRYLARLVLKYCKVAKNWEKVSSKKIDKTLYRVVCGKEYFFPCFRADILLRRNGIEDAREYVNWYIENVEYKDSARTETAEISISVKNSDIILELVDSFGRIEFDTKTLEDIIGDNQNVSEEIVYADGKLQIEWLPNGDPLENKYRFTQSSAFIFNEKEEVLLVKHVDGSYSLPGGTPELNEDILSTCEREIMEEAKVEADNLTYIGSIMVTDNNGDTYIQARFAGKSSKVLPYEKGEFETEERLWVLPSDIHKYLPYAKGVVFMKSLADAIGALREKNI